MSNVIAAALRELIAAGVTGDALVTAVERIEVATLPRRTAHAERQARYRERHKASQSVTSDDAHIYKDTTTSEIKKKKKKVSTALSKTWSLSDADAAFARKQGWAEEKIKLEAHRFFDHAQANNRRQADWPAAWRNWVTSPYQTSGKANGNGKHKSSVMEAFDDLIDRAGGEAVQSDPPMVDITPRRA